MCPAGKCWKRKGSSEGGKCSLHLANAPLENEGKTTQALMKAIGHEPVLVHRQPIRKEKEQKLLEEVKMNK